VLALIALSSVRTKADVLAYATSDGEFGTLDLNTGVYTFLGRTTTGGPTNEELAGLGVGLDGDLYAGWYSNTTLYQVDLADGSLAPVGIGKLTEYIDTGSTTSGLFAIGANEDLYSVNQSNGSVTAIGDTHIGPGSFNALSNGGSTLYYAANGTHLYSLDTTTGTPTLIGNIPEGYVSALLYEDGTLWATLLALSCDCRQIFTINPANGQATFVADQGGTSTATNTSILGLAPEPLVVAVVPEPGYLGLLAAGFATLLLLGRRIRAT
jgi:hypothetical protein